MRRAFGTRLVNCVICEITNEMIEDKCVEYFTEAIKLARRGEKEPAYITLDSDCFYQPTPFVSICMVSAGAPQVHSAQRKSI